MNRPGSDGYRFFSTAKVRFCETDANGHMSHVATILYMEQARCEYMNELGLLDRERMLEERKSFYLVSQSVVYKSQAHFNDELKIYMKVSRIGRSSIDMDYILFDEQESKVVSTGESTMVYVDTATQKGTNLPDDLFERIERFETHFFHEGTKETNDREASSVKRDTLSEIVSTRSHRHP